MKMKHKVEQFNRATQRVDKGSGFLNGIEDLTAAFKLLKNNPKARVSIVVSDDEQIIPISDHIHVSNGVWIDILRDGIKTLQNDFKRLKF